VYAIVLLGLLHFFWMRAAKHDFAEWSVYAGIVTVLLGWRLQRAAWLRDWLDRSGKPLRVGSTTP
jgi:methionine sulfoxide reductase heme-binding subunit